MGFMFFSFNHLNRSDLHTKSQMAVNGVTRNKAQIGAVCMKAQLLKAKANNAMLIAHSFLAKG